MLEFDLKLFNLVENISQFSRLQKQYIIIFSDVFFILLSVWISFSLRLERLYPFDDFNQFVLVSSTALVLAIPVFIGFSLYRAVTRYVGMEALWVVFKSVTAFSLIWGVITINLDVGIPQSVPFIIWLVLLILIGGSRVLARDLFTKVENRKVKKTKQKDIYIYGAGKTGVQLAKALKHDSNLNIAGFIDDSESLQYQNVLGLKVNSFESIEKKFTLASDKVLIQNEVLLAIPSVSHSSRIAIINKLKSLPVKVIVLPDLSELAQGKINIDFIKKINIADLLGRGAVQPNKMLLNSNIKGKTILVTGAGGSIGSELCRQIINLNPKQLVLFEQNELALYQIEKELLGVLSEKNKDIVLLPVLGCVVNQKRVERVCNNFGVETIYHSAAYKHVPMVEKNISEGVKNNIFGTFHCAQAAINTQVETFVLISTDKAVRPTNIMGATKRFAELILQGLAGSNNKHKTCFTMVRFGNVLGSSGSVIPLFKEQIRNSKIVTVTDPEIIRYFMTIPEAAQLVIQAGAMGKGGDVFVLDMGEPIKILDLAKRIIHLSGYEVKDENNPKGDIEIIFTGLRPGEKLYEELLIGNNVSKTDHPRIMRAEEDILSWDSIEDFMQRMTATSENESGIRDILQEAISGFNHQGEVVDILGSHSQAKK
jgi:FlaA1/EpsC-like NDP-sugar epimerase